MAEHAVLSASSAERWINCPGSVHMASLFPQSSSLAAEEGTLAHQLAEYLLNENGKKVNAIDYAHGLSVLAEAINRFYGEHPDLHDDFGDMMEALQPYIDYVAREYREALTADPAAVLLTEQRVDFSDVVPGGFGTSDVVIIADGRVTVIDLKYGKGVPVSAVGNPQIRLYALGAINAFDIMYDFDRVKMVIYQPRLDSVTEEEMRVDDLRQWAETTVKPAAMAALSDNPPYCPGEWCSSHFCPGAGACKMCAAHMLALGREDQALLTDDELAYVLGQLDQIQKWAKAVDTYALTVIQNGHPIPGWKVVEGRSNRVFTDEDKVVAAAIDAGYDRTMLYTQKLIGITEMEKLVGKKNFAKIFGGLVIKPAGAPKLAPESDPRPAYSPDEAIKNEFD